MIVLLGLVLLVAAVVVGVAGVLTNGGQGHAVTHFAALGYHVTGSTGTLFLYGIVIGAVAVAGLGLLLAGARRTARRGSAARRGLRQSRRETAAASSDRDTLISQRDTARAYTASTLGNGNGKGNGKGNGNGTGNRDPGPRGRRPGRRLFRRAAAPQGAPQPQPPAGQAAADDAATPAPASAPAPAE
jgi:hypothetical protein